MCGAVSATRHRHPVCRPPPHAHTLPVGTALSHMRRCKRLQRAPKSPKVRAWLPPVARRRYPFQRISFLSLFCFVFLRPTIVAAKSLSCAIWQLCLCAVLCDCYPSRRAPLGCRACVGAGSRTMLPRQRKYELCYLWRRDGGPVSNPVFGGDSVLFSSGVPSLLRAPRALWLRVAAQSFSFCHTADRACRQAAFLFA